MIVKALAYSKTRGWLNSHVWIPFRIQLTYGRGFEQKHEVQKQLSILTSPLQKANIIHRLDYSV